MARISETFKENLGVKIMSIVLTTVAGIMLYIGLQIYTNSMYQYYSKSFKKGQIAETDILVNSSVDVFDEEATLQLQAYNSQAVLPVFTYSIDTSLEVLDKFNSLKESYSSDVLSISYEILSDILNEGFYNYSDIQTAKNEGYSTINLFKNSKETKLSINDQIVSDFNYLSVVNSKLKKYEDKNLSLKDASDISSIISELLVPNVKYDALMTEQNRQQAIKNTAPVYISFEKGQLLLEKDRVVTEEQLYLISLLGASSTVTISDILGKSAFILISMVLAWGLFFSEINKEKFHKVQYLLISSIGLFCSCVGSFFMVNCAISYGVKFVESFLPICFVPVLITMITGRKNLGFYASFIVGLLMSSIPGATYLTFFFCTLSGVICCSVVRFFNRRTDMFLQWLLSIGLTSVNVVLFIFIGAFSYKEIIPALLGNAIIVTAVHILITIILPILERLFNLPTVFRLNELAYSNNSLVTKLAEAAPGTYSHSKMVSELSEAASKSIGANYVLARVGGLYHDIGKTEHPEYFVENQSDGNNKLAELNPSLSVSVIKSHVKVGADKAREAGLPGELVDIIANHHGNDIISYFFNEAKKQADEDDIVSSADFSYSSSSIPETKECAIVMLADSIEAAARTVTDPTAAKFTKLINTIVFGKIERGQLDNCDLSMKEIDSIRESFLKTLSAQYHNRIEYPDEEDAK